MENWIRLGARLDEAGSGSSGGGGDSGQQSQQQGQGDGQQPSGQQPPPTAQSQQQGTPEGFVPRDSHLAVTRERDELKRQIDAQETERQKQQGEWQKLAEKHEGEAKAWKGRFESTARRAAFVATAASSKDRIADPDAAYKLALADGLLNDLKVDDDGNVDSKAVDEAVKSTIGKYAFLKAGSGSFGGERSGQQPDNAPDLAKMSPRERMEYGIAQDTRARTGRSA